MNIGQAKGVNSRTGVVKQPLRSRGRTLRLSQRQVKNFCVFCEYMPNSFPKAAPFAAAEVIAIDPHTDQVMCDGGGGPLGHPTVYYAFDGKDTVECLYCDRTFVRTKPKKS